MQEYLSSYYGLLSQSLLGAQASIDVTVGSRRLLQVYVTCGLIAKDLIAVYVVLNTLNYSIPAYHLYVHLFLDSPDQFPLFYLLIDQDEPFCLQFIARYGLIRPLLLYCTSCAGHLDTHGLTAFLANSFTKDRRVLEYLILSGR